MFEALIAKIAAKIATIVAEQLVALLPVIGAAVAKAVWVQIAEFLPDLPDLPDAGEIAEQVRESVNTIPDIDIPVLSDVFDLTEFLKGIR